MRFSQAFNGRFYIEATPLWGFYSRTPQKSWHRQPFQPKHTINSWGDIEGADLIDVTSKDLRFANWFLTRIRLEACLPQYYTVGHRFIRLTRAFPAGFKCPPVPLSYAEVRGIIDRQRQLEKEALQKIKLEKVKRKKEAEAAKKRKGRKR